MNPAQPLTRIDGTPSAFESGEMASVPETPDTSRIRRTLRDAIARVHDKLDELGGSDTIADALPEKATRMALAAFTEDELELEEEADDPGGDARAD